MSSINTISAEKLARLIGTPKGPVLIDVRTEEDFAADPRLVPGSFRRPFAEAPAWASEFAGRSAVVICQRGLKLSHGAAAWLRHEGVPADALEAASRPGATPAFRWSGEDKLPPRDAEGRTVWVTRARPKVDRIACPWLIRRFVDPRRGVPVRRAGRGRGRRRALRRHALRHRRRLLEPPRRALHLRRHGRGVRPREPSRSSASPRSSAAPTRRASILRRKPPACSPPRSACRACTPTISSSSRPACSLYDAFYRWCRDASDETHNWPSNKAGAWMASRRFRTSPPASVRASRPSPRRSASGCASRS